MNALIKNLNTNRNSLLVLINLLLIWAGLIIPSSAGKPWTDQSLAAWLEKNNRNEALFIETLDIIQNNKNQTIYQQVGNEELRSGLKRRPILQEANAQTPFVRKVEYTARINRSRAVDIHIRIADFRNEKKQRLIKHPLKEVMVDEKPSQEGLRIMQSDANGFFRYHLAPRHSVGTICFQFRKGKEKHEIYLCLTDKNKPFTLMREEKNNGNLPN